jgi:hypothetical protein
MAKFYITARYIQCLVQAEDAEGAALWALHQAVSEGTSRSGEAFSPEQILGLLAQWGRKISVSEVGYGRADAGVFRTDETLESYWELMDALEQLCARWEERDTFTDGAIGEEVSSERTRSGGAAAGDTPSDNVGEPLVVFRGGVEHDSNLGANSSRGATATSAAWYQPGRSTECQYC